MYEEGPMGDPHKSLLYNNISGMCISKLRVGNYFHSYTSSKNLFGGTTNSKLRVGNYFHVEGLIDSNQRLTFRPEILDSLGDAMLLTEIGTLRHFVSSGNST